MAAGDITIYDKWLHSQSGDSTLSGMPVDFDTDTLKIVLLDNTFTPDTTASSTQEHFDDVSAKEVSTGTAYTGPITLGTITLTVSSGVVTFDAADVSILVDAGGGFTDARHIAFFKDTGTPSTSPLIAIGDLGSDRDNTLSNIDFTWGANGIITWTKV